MGKLKYRVKRLRRIYLAKLRLTRVFPTVLSVLTVILPRRGNPLILLLKVVLRIFLP
ncbi:hypothetical protein C1752_03419 [Acaryochloris thomasi RCC1774]|uniref:Uncharacterized protein n=1 Tax=Acaryochloris thomasi RCC1774 TaxID=1764569 RepID=A0A2W1JFX1_9CYAN|nr:hypothetical protein C1752_03419 [Acaryochloris thomasi RCC1774]